MVTGLTVMTEKSAPIFVPRKLGQRRAAADREPTTARADGSQPRNQAQG
jgi:hypothetical protein